MHKKRFSDARSHIGQSIALFERCDAAILLAEAQAVLGGLP
jgi:hypothetical protein